jgi:hypothetical protein
MQIRGGVMRREEIQRLVSEYFQRSLENAEDLRADGIGVLKGEDGVYGESGLEGLELHLEGLIEDLARGELRSITRVADNILKEAGVDLPKESHEYRKLAREALKGAIEAIRTELAQRKGDYSNERAKLLPATPAAPTAPSIADKPAVKLSAAVSEYVKEHSAGGHWRKKTKEEAEGIYRLLVGIVGDKDMAELDYKVLSGFRDALLRFPSNWTKRPAYRGKTISEVVAMGASPTPLSVTSVNKHLSQTGAFLKFCVKCFVCHSHGFWRTALMSLISSSRPLRTSSSLADCLPFENGATVDRYSLSSSRNDLNWGGKWVSSSGGPVSDPIIASRFNTPLATGSEPPFPDRSLMRSWSLFSQKTSSWNVS